MFLYRLWSCSMCFHVLPMAVAIWVAVLDPTIVETCRAISHSSFLNLIKIQCWDLTLMISLRTCEGCLQCAAFFQVWLSGQAPHFNTWRRADWIWRKMEAWPPSGSLPQSSRRKRITWYGVSENEEKGTYVHNVTEKECIDGIDLECGWRGEGKIWRQS